MRHNFWSKLHFCMKFNFLKMFIALLSTYIRKVNIRHSLLCLLSRFEAVSAWSGISDIAWGARFFFRLVWALLLYPSWFQELGLYRQLHPLCSKDPPQGWYVGNLGASMFFSIKLGRFFPAPCLGGLGCVCRRPILDECHVAIGTEQFSLVCCFIHIFTVKDRLHFFL